MPVFSASRPFVAGELQSRLCPFPTLAAIVGALTEEPDGLNLKSSIVDSDDEWSGGERTVVIALDPAWARITTITEF